MSPVFRIVGQHQFRGLFLKVVVKNVLVNDLCSQLMPDREDRQRRPLKLKATVAVLAVVVENL